MHNILNEIVMGGMVLETNMAEIMVHIDAQSKLEKQEVCITLFLLIFNLVRVDKLLRGITLQACSLRSV